MASAPHGQSVPRPAQNLDEMQRGWKNIMRTASGCGGAAIVAATASAHYFEDPTDAPLVPLAGAAYHRLDASYGAGTINVVSDQPMRAVYGLTRGAATLLTGGLRRCRRRASASPNRRAAQASTPTRGLGSCGWLTCSGSPQRNGLL